MLYISTQVSRKRLRKIRPMECSGTLPQPAPMQPEISPSLCWTDADSLTLEQICQELELKETVLDYCMPSPPAQVQADVLRTPQSRPRKAAACPKQMRIKSTTTDVKPILGRINAPWLPNGRYQKLRPQASSDKPKRSCKSTTSSMVNAATLTSAPDATLTSPIISSISTTPSSSDLASLIYSTYIFDQLNSHSNLELNLY